MCFIKVDRRPIADFRLDRMLMSGKIVENGATGCSEALTLIQVSK